VDYTNAFCQAELNEEVYIEIPHGFDPDEPGEFVLKLKKSLYGLKQAPKTFFEKLKEGLEQRGFRQSDVDQCLFMKDEMICVVYVDDTIFAGPDATKLEAEINSLGDEKSPTGEIQHKFDLKSEGSIEDFLGINFKQVGPNKFVLTQTGLIKKILEAASMTDCHTKSTPASTTTLGTDARGAPFNESWEYASIVGMLMYLATNSRPDLAFSVNQCARFTHCPRASHAKAVKHILRYLQGTKDKGLEFQLSNELSLDCFVDADFAGLWGQEDDQDPVCAKSRTGFLITFAGCPLLWGSKLQHEISLSTMEAEYVALSYAMRQLIPIRETLIEIQSQVLAGSKRLQCTTHSTAFEEVSADGELEQGAHAHDVSAPNKSNSGATHERGGIPPSNVYEDNNACLKFAVAPKMSSRTKHIATKYHFFRTKVKELAIIIQRIDTKEQTADIFTKGLTEDTFQYLRKKLMGW
jgi:hypothetical protein